MNKQTKEQIYDLVMDYLITKPGIQEELFGDPIIITVQGAPIDVTIYHQFNKSVLCYSKKTFFGFNKPVSNRWKAIKILSQWLFKGVSPKTYVTTWSEVFSINLD